MTGPDHFKKRDEVSPSDHTIATRMDGMSKDIEAAVLEKIRISKKFALQLDKSTDISKHSQLLANVRFVDESVIRENFSFCIELTTTTGVEIFYVTSEYLEKED